MKKMLAMVLCLVLAIISVGCSTGSNSIQNDNSSELSPKEKYDNAVSLMNDKKYDEAIGIFEQIDYEDSKELKKTASYIYACELFNEKEFENAYNYFVKADDYLDSKKNTNKSAYYEGVKLVKSEQHWRSIEWFRKVLNDDEFKSSAEKHIIEITTSLIGNAWYSSYTNSKGVTLQIEFKYFESKDNLYIAHADKSNGYKQVASLHGSLEVGAENSKYYHSETTFGGSWDAVEFSFTSANRMYVYCSAKSIGKAITGSYTAKYTPTVYYKIDNEVYPTLSIPEIDINGNIISNNDSNENDSTDISSTQSGNSIPNKNTTTNTNTNSKPNNSSNNVSSKPSNNINSKPTNNTSSKPSSSVHTHSYSNATCTKPATCSCGATNGKALGHSWKEATCKMPKTCNKCGQTDGSKLNHNYKNEKCTMCGEKSANFPKDSDIKLEYPASLKDNGVTFKILSYEINNMDEYFEGKAKIKITAEIIEGFYADITAGFGIKYYDINGNDITKWKPYDLDRITKADSSRKYYYEVGDIGISEFEIPANCRKIVLISIR